MLVRFTDFYAIAYDYIANNTNSNLLELFCANIQNENVTYLKPLKFEYYDIDDNAFNCMIYDKEKFETFNLNISYEDFFINAIVEFVEKAYKKYNKNNIKFIFDDNIIKIFGKELYKNAINKSIEYLNKKYQIEIEYEFIHIANLAYGEVILMEFGFGYTPYNLYTTRYENNIISKEHKYTEVIDKEIYNRLKNGESFDDIKYLMETFIMDNDIDKYGFKPAKYLTIVDFNAYTTYYYTYSIIDYNISLYNIEKIDLGFMNIVEWIYNKSNKSESIGYKFKSLISNLCYLDKANNIYIKYYKININSNDFYINSPLKLITEKIVQIKHEILKKHQFDKKIIFRYNIENVVELIIKNIELKQMLFNGQCHKIIENYNYLNKFLQNEIKICANYTCADVVDKNTGSNKIHINIKLSDYGYKYQCKLDDKINEI